MFEVSLRFVWRVTGVWTGVCRFVDEIWPSFHAFNCWTLPPLFNKLLSLRALTGPWGSHWETFFKVYFHTSSLQFLKFLYSIWLSLVSKQGRNVNQSYCKSYLEKEIPLINHLVIINKNIPQPPIWNFHASE